MILGIVGSGPVARELRAAARGNITVGDVAEADVVVEAMPEDVDAKAEVLARLHRDVPATTVLATTTVALSVARLAGASGRPEKVAGVHLHGPGLVELVTHDECEPATIERLQALCAALGTRAVVVPDIPGGVISQLLYPYLFGAVELLERSGMSAADVDACMTLGAGHPIGPLALLDDIGLDVAYATAHNLGIRPPARLAAMVGEGRLGRKAGYGFYDHASNGDRHEHDLAQR